MFELTSEIRDSHFHFDFEDCNICLKSKYFTEITVQLQVPIALHCATSLHKSIEHFARHPHWRRSQRSVRWLTQVQWESTQINSKQSHWIQSKSLKPLLVQNIFHTININTLSSVRLYTNVNCAEYNGYIRWASAVFELTSESPDSDFHFYSWGL